MAYNLTIHISLPRVMFFSMHISFHILWKSIEFYVCTQLASLCKNVTKILSLESVSEISDKH